MNKEERNFFLFLLGARSFSSKDRASLSVLLAVASVGILSSSAPLALEVEGLQEAVELDSEVELIVPEHAASATVRRDTCHVANADNAHLTTSNSLFFPHFVRLCAYARRRLLCAGIMYASLPCAYTCGKFP